MVKVCQIITIQQRYDSRIFLKQSMSLVKNGFDVTILVADDKPKEISGGVVFLPMGYVFKNRMDRLIKNRSFVLKLALDVDADIYQINSIDNLNLALKLKSFGKRVVFDSREDHPADISEKEWIPMGLRKVIALAYEEYEKKILRDLDAVLTPTPHIYKRIKMVNKNTHVVTNYPIIDNEFDFFDRSMRGECVCFVGTMSPLDMHEKIIKAIQMTKATKYLIAVTERSKYTEDLFDLACRLGIKNRIEFVGPMPYADLPKFHNRARAGMAIRAYAANFGYKEGSLGVIKFFHYLASGLPVVCTDFNIWKKIVTDYDCGISVNPYSVEEIKNAIDFINKNPDILERMSINARAAAVEKFNWKTQENIYLDVYRNL